MAIRPLSVLRQLCIGGAVLALSTSTDAATPRKAPNRGQGAATAPKLPGDAVQRLQSGDPARIQSALDDVRVTGQGGAAAVPAIVALLRQGASLGLARAAIDTLGETESEEASEVLSWYSRHHDVALRLSAVRALAHARGPESVPALRVALSDSDPDVRGLAAAGLGSLKAREAIGDLFAALDHEVKEAAASIGQLCTPTECEKLMDDLGRMPVDVMTGGVDRMLFRPVSEVGDDLKLRVVARVRGLGTSVAHAYLRGAQARWPKGGSTVVRQAIDEAVRATSESPGPRSRGGRR